MIRFGVAGYPPNFYLSSYKRRREDILRWIPEVGLEALELQMTYGPKTGLDTCRLFRQMSEDHKVRLSVHASYFIVLTSSDREKVANSIDTLKRTFDLSNELGAAEVVLHPGSTYNASPVDAISRFVENADRFLSEYGETAPRIFVETAGKLGQLGSVDEILTICRQLPLIHPCIDFGHVHARTLGSLGNGEAIHHLMEKLIEFLQHRSERRAHFHYTPIHYGPRGEIQHRAIDDIQPDGILHWKGEAGSQDRFHPRFESVAVALAQFQLDATVISETHNSQDSGAVALKRAYYNFLG